MEYRPSGTRPRVIAEGCRGCSHCSQCAVPGAIPDSLSSQRQDARLRRPVDGRLRKARNELLFISPRLHDIFVSQQHHRSHTSASYSAALWTNADDRLPFDPLGRVESGNGVIEGRDGADVRP